VTDRHVPRVALTRAEAATALGVSLTFFKQNIQPELRVVRIGSVRLFPVADLERWADERAERVLDDLESHQPKKPPRGRNLRGQAPGQEQLAPTQKGRY
jgi:hypothetical protein